MKHSNPLEPGSAVVDKHTRTQTPSTEFVFNLDVDRSTKLLLGPHTDTLLQPEWFKRHHILSQAQTPHFSPLPPNPPLGHSLSPHHDVQNISPQLTQIKEKEKPKQRPLRRENPHTNSPCKTLSSTTCSAPATHHIQTALDLAEIPFRMVGRRQAQSRMLLPHPFHNIASLKKKKKPNFTGLRIVTCVKHPQDHSNSASANK